MITKVVGTQLTLDGGEVEVRKQKFEVPVGKLREMAEEDLTTCTYCDKVISKRRSREMRSYTSPWAEEASIVDHYCMDCDSRGNYDDSDFSSEYCEWCDRDIVQRCLANGWRGYFRIYEETLVCVACLQRHFMENGISEFEVEDERFYPDFYNHEELREAGFIPKVTCTTPDDVAKVVAPLLTSHICLIDQGPTGIGVGADYVEVWVKERSDVGICS